ncbi:MAG: hypothetical protein A2V83_04595 [Nitrospirae bacterium RBG_16_64_22]|nr:MAG: hypothetical protein A2V83_04595 [Nitrospirae bacterium RBG_16_64_22]
MTAPAMARRLDGRVALVTGASGGIGGAVARRLSAEGASVALHFNRSREAAERLKGGMIGEAEVFQADLTRAVSAAGLVDEVVGRFGKIDILVHASGIRKDALLFNMAEETWDEIITANLKSLFAVAKACMRPMIGKRSGRIIAVASLSGITGLPGQTHYAASKGGMISFVKALALETARFGITVNAVAPGLIETAMIADSSFASVKEKILSFVPMRRVGTPEEVAGPVAFLASDEASYVTGQTIPIAGGLP